jgi:predicted YcjX-like family ATPase
MVLTSVTDRLGNAAGSAVGAVSGRFADRVIRLGVTGLSRAGKTVFITVFGGQSAEPRAHAATLGRQ